MSGGIGGIGSSMGNLGVSQMSSITKSSSENTMLSAHKKKHHGEDTSFAVTLNTLNTQNTQGIQSGAGGEAGTLVNKFA